MEKQLHRTGHGVDLFRLGEMLDALSEPGRLRIAFLLTRHEKLCACQIARVLSLPMNEVARHLESLRRQRIVDARRCEGWVCYGLAEDDRLVASLAPTIAPLAGEEPQLAADLASLHCTDCVDSLSACQSSPVEASCVR